MSWQINAMLIVSADVEAPTEEVAWERFVKACESMKQDAAHQDVLNMAILDVAQDEIIDESEEEEDGA